MKTFKGTKGEWKIGEVNELECSKENNIVVWSEERELTEDGKYQMICSISTTQNYTEEDAYNAELIAAAPDLLEALLKVEPLMKAGFENSPLHLKIKKAISKALD